MCAQLLGGGKYLKFYIDCQEVPDPVHKSDQDNANLALAENVKWYPAPMDEGRKRVLGIIAGILVARHLKITDDLVRTRDNPHQEHGHRRNLVGKTHERKD
jgi:hypothetical protein